MASNTMTVDFSFPNGLLQPAKCLVALTGLDIRNNAVHMAIWDFFKAARRGEKKPVNYRLVSADHLYPKKKEPVVGEDTSVPPSTSGILKLNWINKHTNELPSVVVFFFDLDWTHPQWEEKVTECASKIKVIRSSLNRHGTEVCAALIQSVKPNPSGTDLAVSEKASQLCSACDLPSPNLFVMPYVERPEGYVNRLEATFYEMALLYYGNLIKKIRIIRDANRLLAIRRMLKLAFFTEIKQDYKEALKHYVATYKYITEFMTLNEHRIMEYKMIAGFVNYKTCKLFFESDDPRSAISQHQKFLETFRRERGPPQLLFQHLEWISNQYTAFGDLFADAVRKSLKPTQIQHPGIHYHQAVLHQLERRKLKEKLCREAYDSLPHPLPHPFTEIPATEYIGERPWRVGLNDNQPSSSKLKEKAITMLQAHEYSTNTSPQVCVLLSNALHHFKELDYCTDHMVNHLKVLLSEEYFVVKDYQKCLALLQVAVVNYRTKHWWKILSHVLRIMLRCSYELGLVTSYVSVCLELISRFIPALFKEKSRLQDNLNLVLSDNVPNPEPSIEQSGNEPVQELWKQEFNSLQKGPVVEENNGNLIRMSDLVSCVECKSWFTEHSYTSDSLLRLEIYLRSSAPHVIKFTGIKVLFDHEECNRWCVLDEEVVLEPGKHKQLVFEFPTTSDTLQVVSVEATMNPFRLVWVEGISRCGFESKDWHWNRIRTRSSTLILQREPQIDLSLDHAPPILLSEVYPVTIRVKNNEEKEIKKIFLIVVLLQDYQQTTQQQLKDSGFPKIRLYSNHPSPSPFPLPPTSPQTDSHYCFEASCQSLLPRDEFEAKFYVKSYSIGAHRININCSYRVDCLVKEGFDLIECKCEKEEVVSIETVTPLRISHKILNRQFQPQDCVFFNEPFIVQTSVVSLASWKVKVSDTQYQWKEDVAVVTQLPKQISNMVLSQQDIGSEVQCVTVSSSQSLGTDVYAPLGTYTVKWKREELEDRGGGAEPAIASVNLPNVHVKSLPYSLTIDLPAYATQHQLFTITYKLQNRTVYVQEFDAVLQSSTDFMYSGNRVTTFRVLPQSTHLFSFNLFPLNVGHVLLPQLEVVCTSQPKLDDQVLRGTTSNLPNSVFVMPLATGKTQDVMLNGLKSQSATASV